MLKEAQGVKCAIKEGFQRDSHIATHDHLNSSYTCIAS